MSKYVLDFVFDERTGETKVTIDFLDDSMSALEMNEAVRSGEIREKTLDIVEKVLGSEVAEKVRKGKIELVCLDHNPDRKKPAPGIALPDEIGQKRGIEN